MAVLDADVLVLRCERGGSYLDGIPGLGADFSAAVSSLKALIGSRGNAEIACVGSSFGAIPALVAGMELGAKTVLLAGALNTRVASLTDEPGVIDLDQLVPRVMSSRGELPRVNLVFGQDDERDANAAWRIAAMMPHRTITSVPGAGHACLWPLVERGEFAGSISSKVFGR